MSQVLSQDEIDALLGGLDDVAEPEAEETGVSQSTDKDVIAYDFANAAAMSRVKFPGFAIINDHFNRGLRSTLSSMLRVMVDSTVVPIEIIPFKEFLKRVPVPSSLHILRLNPLRGHAMMVVDSQLVFCIVEIFLGATSLGSSRVEGREFTSIEQRLIKRIVSSLLKDWARAWASIYPIDIHYIRSEINPQFAKIIPDEDAVIVSKFQLDIEEMSGVIYLSLPSACPSAVSSCIMSPVSRSSTSLPVSSAVPRGTSISTGMSPMFFKRSSLHAGSSDSSAWKEVCSFFLMGWITLTGRLRYMTPLISSMSNWNFDTITASSSGIIFANWGLISLRM